jgi:hypothetical protein
MRAPWLALLIAGTGCISPLTSLTSERAVSIGAQRYLLRARDDAGRDVDRVADALSTATENLTIWGGLELPVTVHLLPDHASLERAVRRPGFAWLRAWARFDDVLLQAPSTWAPTQEPLVELLTHELTHCLMFQRSGGADDWGRRGIPLWFREGMAVWTARQGDKYPTLEDISTWVAQHRELDTFRDGEALSRDFSGPVYGIAHHAFAFLTRRYGIDTVKRVMAHMKGGQSFHHAFTAAVGLTPKDFQRDFETYLRLKGFRDWARPVGRPPKRLEDVLRAR